MFEPVVSAVDKIVEHSESRVLPLLSIDVQQYGYYKLSLVFVAVVDTQQRLIGKPITAN